MGNDRSVATLIEIDDPTDPRLADYISLRDMDLRKHVEYEQGLFLAEGEKVVRRAVAAGYGVRSLLMAPRWLDGLSDVLDLAGDAPCYVVSEALAEAVTGFHVHRGALASLARRPLPSVEEVIEGARRILVLEDIVDHTNLGAIFRCAAALGVDAIVLSPRCADPLYRRSIKVGMGAVFAVPWARMEDWYDAMGDLSSRGFATLALTPADDAIPMKELDPTLRSRKLALVLGSEGPGLSPRWMSSADHRVCIPITDKVDSLNVAAAAAIACYELLQ